MDKVEERLPEHGQVILVRYKDGVGPYSWYKYPTTLVLACMYRRNIYETWFQDKSTLHPLPKLEDIEV